MTRPDLVPAMFGLSGWELIIILIVALLLFGKRLPDIMRGMGSSVKEFKKGMEEGPPQAGQAPAGPPQVQAAPPQAPPAAPSGSVARNGSPAANDPSHPPKA